MKKGSRHKASSVSRNLRGLELANRGWLDEAVREFSRAIEADPSLPFPRINRANVYLQQGHFLYALRDLLAAVETSAGDAATHYHLGTCLARFGQEIAVRELQQARQLEPDNIDVLVQLAMIQAEQGDFAAAEQTLQEALDIDGDEPLVHREMGALKLDNGQFHQAIVHLKRALAAWPDDLDTMLDVAAAYIQAGFYQQAETQLKSALALEPRCLHALYNLAAIYADWKTGSNRISLCRAHLEEAFRLQPQVVRQWLAGDQMFANVSKSDWFQALLSESGGENQQS